MRGRAAACGKNASDALAVERGNVRRCHFVHHQNVGLFRRLLGLDTSQAGQHATTDVTQIRRALGQQLVVQRLLLLRGVFDFLDPGGFGAQAFFQPYLHVLA